MQVSSWHMVIYDRLKVESSQFWLDFSVASLVSEILSDQSCDTWFRHHFTQWWLNDWPWSNLYGGSLHLLPSPVPVTLRHHLIVSVPGETDYHILYPSPPLENYDGALMPPLITLLFFFHMHGRITYRGQNLGCVGKHLKTSELLYEHSAGGQVKLSK